MKHLEMIRKSFLVLLVSVFITVSAFASVIPAEEGYVIPHRISNNEFFSGKCAAGYVGFGYL